VRSSPSTRSPRLRSNSSLGGIIRQRLPCFLGATYGYRVWDRYHWQWQALLERLGTRRSSQVLVSLRHRSGRRVRLDASERRVLRWACRMVKQWASTDRRAKIPPLARTPATGLHRPGGEE